MSDVATAVAAPSVKKEGIGVVSRGTMHNLDPRTITRKEGFNPRFDFGEIEELAKSIKANGLYMPLRVKRMQAPVDGKYFELIDGDRRLTAIEHLLSKGEVFEKGVPAIIVDKGQDDVESLFQALETNAGKALLPLEEAMAYKRLKDAGMTARAISNRLSRDYVHVCNSLALLDADPAIQEAVKNGEVGVTIAKQIAVHARDDKAKQAELLAAAKQAKAIKGPAGKDARAAAKRAIDDKRRANAEKKGKQLKMRALDDKELSAIGMKLAQHVAKLLGEAGKPADFDIRKWVKEDDNYALAAAFGALEALKAAAGQRVNLSF